MRDSSLSACTQAIVAAEGATVGEVLARSRAATAFRCSALKVAFWATEVESGTGIQGI